MIRWHLILSNQVCLVSVETIYFKISLLILSQDGGAWDEPSFSKASGGPTVFLNSSGQFFVCVCPLTSGLVTKITHVNRRSCRILWLSRYDFHAERQARTPPPHCLSSVRLSGNRRLIINTCHTRTSNRVLQWAHTHSVRYRRPTPTCSQPQTDVRTHCSDTASAFICATCLMYTKEKSNNDW